MANQKKHQNGGFSSSIGFVIACVGSAVGLGNIWLFPYRLGQYGGAAFLIPYLLFVFLFGWVGLSAEFGIGRLAGTGTIGAYERCFQERDPRLKRVGSVVSWLPLMGSLGIAIGYAVILGWVLNSLAGALSGTLMTAEPTAFFTAAASHFGNPLWHTVVIAMVCLVLMFGVTSGIEKVSRILMPLFYVLFIILAIWVATLPGAGEGYRFLLVPDWSKLLEPYTWVMAMGQAFFSLSITGSGMIVYGAYLDKKEDIPKASLRTAIFDTMAALLSALAIMPAVFAYGLDVKSGPPLMFITLPTVFQQMPMGRLFAAFFFLSVLFAGLTSLINMFEAVSESWQTHFKLGRKTAVVICSALTIGVGIFMESEERVGAWMDFITIQVVPIGAVLGAISIYYVLGWSKLRKELETGRQKPLSRAFGPVGKYVYVPLTILVVILGFVFHGIG
ncbi:Na+-dependent transporters of the SNF family [uncultured Flavonifractor sp.]|uniref:Sodium-dependent transporter n=1 Tax=Flintibacter hominis TaxID=2763048 RepID=A0A8J6JA81_9FIRM|nr:MULTISPECIES: sodium-dependent transporter [Eubacteriales]MBS5590641.1 sodium-dependent transporter [Clostridiales bacterium]SCI16382.1 Na+-dependent transporters of the SNF family [uncultured Flavonifractor sp.]MBC5722777.1 sodium-dependent transporter [Flintibacter hominis]MCH1978974.1 sodium-dependent transporter [Lawsonibacter sp. OA9]MCU6701815.1 sodium-dependent transporter [Muriventricola aceti]